MPSIQRAVLGGVWTLSLLAGCNYTATSMGGATTAVAQESSAPKGGQVGSAQIGVNTAAAAVPTFDVVSATASVNGTVSVLPGASQTVTVAFTSADGKPVTGLSLSNTTLPAGWSGPADFTCNAAGSGSNCVLTLTYSPSVGQSGTLNLGYVYLGDKTPPPGTMVSIPYTASTSNNVLATAAPIGQINAAVGSGSQSVSVNFTTDDGNAATGLSVTSSLASLPAGWTTATPTFACTVVSNGSGCQLVLNYAPKAAGSGTLTLKYAYTDLSGMARTGAINLPYSTTANGSVVATVSPTGQIDAVKAGGQQAVTVTFTTDNGQPAKNLVLISPLASLPAGWSSAGSSFSCSTVASGNGCQLPLSFAPATLLNGTVTLQYAYTSSTGVFTIGSLNIPYAATTNDNVGATANPSGQINAVVGEAAPSVAVSFATDDARTATTLQLTTDLSALPAGWSTTESTFACAGLAGGTTCQLPLTYDPPAATSGTLTLRYTYLNNAGEAKTGSLNIPFRATTDDAVVATPSTGALTVAAGSTNPVSLTFATDDGNPATDLIVTSDLTMLPPGWTVAASSFQCATVGGTATCQLAMSYQPQTANSGTLTVGFSYTNDAGRVKTGTLSIPYTAQ